MFINHDFIYKILEETKNPSNEEIKEVLEKAKKRDGLSYKDIAILLQAEDENHLEEIYKLAGEIKKDIYGKRVVVFAPLYVSDYCVNNCVYCGYKRDNKFTRRKLTMEEVAEEVKILEKMGHKRLALELGVGLLRQRQDRLPSGFLGAQRLSYGQLRLQGGQGRPA